MTVFLSLVTMFSKTKMDYTLKHVTCILLSSFLLILSFPTPELSFFAWIGFIPLLFAIKEVSYKKAFLLSYLCGIIFFLGILYWLVYVAWIGLIVLSLYLGLYFGFFGVCADYCFKKFANEKKCHSGENENPVQNYSIFILPAIWVILEYLRSHIFTGFGWALLGYSQYKILPIIQIADITGAYGVSFIVMMVNVSLFNVIVRICHSRKWKLKKIPIRSPKGMFLSGIQKKTIRYLVDTSTSFPRFHGNVIVVILVLAITLTYGYVKLNVKINDLSPNKLRVSVIQGNIPQEQKWDPAFKQLILKKYEKLTELASFQRPDLIIWPETSIPGYLTEEPELMNKIPALVQKISIPLLAGVVSKDVIPVPPTVIPAKAGGQKKFNFFNTAVLFSTAGEIIQQYQKRHLVPFGEYIMCEKLFSFLRKLVNIPIGSFTAGKKWTIFNITSQLSLREAESNEAISDYTFAALICFEDVFPELSRNFVKKGADFLINITNDAWFMRTSAPYQHTQASVFRAVENRVNLIRCANTGISCFITPYGRISNTVRDEYGDDRFITGYETADIQIIEQKSFYTKYGDIFILLTFLMILLSLTKIIIPAII